MAYCPKCGAPLKEETPEQEADLPKKEEEPKKGKKKEKIIGGIIAILVMIGGIFLLQPKVESISASYMGNQEEGTVLNEKNEGIRVTGKTKDGKSIKLDNWKVKKEKKLKADSSSEIEIEYKDCTCKLLVECTTSAVQSVEFTYEGETTEGTVIDDKADFKVIEIHKDGTETENDDWKIEKPVTLEADTTSKVTIEADGAKAEVSIKCSTSAITGITASYGGERKAGTVLNEKSDIEVLEIHKDGTKTETDDWKVEKTVTLEADTTSKLKIKAGEFETELSVECSTMTLTELSATYDGKTIEGTVLDASNTGIHVTAKYKNGTTKEITDYKVGQPATLEADKKSSITISYGDKNCTLEVQCTTQSPEQFKASCEAISYEDFARNPDNYDDRKVKFSGKVLQVVEINDLVCLRVQVTGNINDVVFVQYASLGGARILEDDQIVFYGYAAGLYSYESVLGAKITLPKVMAMYVDWN